MQPVAVYYCTRETQKKNRFNKIDCSKELIEQMKEQI